jgi:hypothetical protein
MGLFGRKVLSGFIVALFAFALPAFASNVTISGTTNFSSLDGSVDDQDHLVNGTFTINGDLIVNGSINCNDDGSGNLSGCAMKFAVTGNVIMNAGSGLFAENRIGSGSGGSITINAGGSVTLHGPAGSSSGAVISSAALLSANGVGGAITINSGGATTLEAGTVISSASKGSDAGKILVTSGQSLTASGLVAAGATSTLLATAQTGDVLAGGNATQHGGEIRLQSTSVFDPSVTINSTATIVSQGATDAAGPVTIEGCGVIVRGLVASIVNGDTPTRVVIRSGKEIVVDGSDLGVNSAGAHLGHLRADATKVGAAAKRVDLFAADNITITGPDAALSTIYAVTSNPGSGDPSSTGGTIRVISLRGTVAGSGRTFMAGRNVDSHKGGTIDISGAGTVNLDHAWAEAVGDYSQLKASAAGGHINVRSYAGNVSWVLGNGDVRPVGAGASGVSGQGTIALTACGTVTTSGTTFPTVGPAVGLFPTITTGACSPSAPSLPAGEPALPVCCNVITVINPAVSSGPAGSPFSQTFTQVGAIGTAVFTLATGTLPPGLTLATNGVLSGTPTVTGSFPITVMVTDSQGCTGVGPTYPLQITCPTITVTNPAVNSGTAGVAFSQTFTQSGGVGTTTFFLSSGGLPAGLTLSSAGVLSGTPTQTGTYPITVTATDSNGCTGTGPTYTLTINCQTITVTNPAVSSGTAGTAFSQTFTQSGSIGTTTFSLASGTLPSGLTLSSAGVLSGTPTQTGSFPITVKATDSNGCSGTGPTYTLVIACQTITVTNPAVTSGTAGSAFSQTFTQSGGIGATTFSLASGTLPSGLTLASNGVLSGTPAQTGTFPITVKGTDSNGCSGTGATYTLTIACQTITVTNPAVSTGTAATPFSQMFTQSGAIGSSTFSLASGTLPSGLTLSTAGVLSGSPTQTGSFPITVKVTDANGCTGTGATYTLVIACQTITVTNPVVTTGTVGTPFSQTFTQSGAAGTATFTTSSQLPAGLTLSTAGVLSGTPTQTGTFPIVVTVTDSNGCTGTGATYTLTINCQTITVTNPATNSGTVDTPFSATFTQSGAIGSATFSLASGTLPAGLTLSASGVLSGTPQVPGTFSITVKVTDSNGCTGTGPTYTLTISCQTITVTNPSSTTGTYNTPLSGSFTFTQSGVGTHTPAVFTVNSGSLPSGVSLSSSGVLSGTPAQTGVFSITVKVTDANGCSGIGSTYTLTIAPKLTTKSYVDVGNTQLDGGLPAPATPTVISVAVSNGDSSDAPIVYAVTVPPSNGVLTIFNANGTFLYTPNVGNTAADSFTYTGTSNGISVTRTATINFTGRVWYVDNATGAGTNDGRSNTPFTTLTAVGGAGTATGDYIYISKGSGPTTGAYIMLTSQQLIGAGATLNVGGGVLVVPGNAANTPTLSDTLTLADNVTVAGIDMSTGASSAIGGTNVTGINVTARNVTTTTGIAVTIAGIGSSGTMTFTQINAGTSSGGPVNAISLSNYNGGFTVTGDGGATSNGSGGTIQRTTSHAINLNAISGAGVSLNYMNISESGANGINAAGVNNVTVNHCNVSDTAGNTAVDDGIKLVNTTGSIAITKSAVTGSRHQGITIDNLNTNLAGLTMTATTVNGTAGGDGMLMQMRGTSVLTSGTIGGASAADGNTFSNNSSTGLQVIGSDTSNSTLTVKNNAATGNNAGMDIDLSQAGGMTLVAESNTFNNHQSTALNIFSSTSTTGGTMSAVIRNNTIGTAGVFNSGSFFGDGIRVALNGGTHGVLTIDGNIIREVPNARGIDIDAEGYTSANSVNVKIINNQVIRPTGASGDIGCGPGVPCPAGSIVVIVDKNAVASESICSVITGNSAYDPTSWPLGSESAFYLARRSSQTLNLEGNTSQTPQQVILNNNTVTNLTNPGFGDFTDESGNVVVVAPGSCGTFP